MLAEIGIVFLVMVALMILGLPVGVCFAGGGVILLLLANIGPSWALEQSFHILSAFNFLALPLYIILGTTLGHAGMASKLSDFATSLVGRLRGGLGVALILANGMFGAMSGSALSALAGVGKAFLPIMEKEGYPRSYAIALLIPSAVLSCLIPPSGFMIVFGFMGRLPIAYCFLAGAVPGLILLTFLSITHLIMARRIPTIGVPPKVSFKEHLVQIAKSGYSNSLTLLIPVLVLGIIYGGVGTPAESASIGATYSLILALFVYRSLSWKQAGIVFLDSARLVGTIIILFFFFLILSRVLIIERVSEQLLALMFGLSSNKWALMGMLNILMVLMGMIMDDASTNIIASIILLPIAVRLGFQPLHFAAIAAVNLELGLITPPVAPLLYLGGHLAGDMPLGRYVKPVLVYIAFAFIPTLLITLFIPEVSLTLPALFARTA